MTRVSLNIVVYNESGRIGDCLQDVRPHVDEVVVVDQSSTDDTFEIASRHADVCVRDHHHGFCEASRQLAARRSSADWILVLDADEKMTPRFKSELRALTARGRDGYRLMREFYLDDRLEGRGDTHYRLFRKDRVRFLPEIHTEPQPVSNKVERLDYVAITHTKSLREQIEDELRYERIVEASDLSPQLKRERLALNVHLEHEREASQGRSSDTR